MIIDIDAPVDAQLHGRVIDDLRPDVESLDLQRQRAVRRRRDEVVAGGRLGQVIGTHRLLVEAVGSDRLIGAEDVEVDLADVLVDARPGGKGDLRTGVQFLGEVVGERRGVGVRVLVEVKAVLIVVLVGRSGAGDSVAVEGVGGVPVQVGVEINRAGQIGRAGATLIDRVGLIGDGTPVAGGESGEVLRQCVAPLVVGRDVELAGTGCSGTRRCAARDVVGRTECGDNAATDAHAVVEGGQCTALAGGVQVLADIGLLDQHVALGLAVGVRAEQVITVAAAVRHGLDAVGVVLAVVPDSGGVPRAGCRAGERHRIRRHLVDGLGEVVVPVGLGVIARAEGAVGRRDDDRRFAIQWAVGSARFRGARVFEDGVGAHPGVEQAGDEVRRVLRQTAGIATARRGADLHGDMRAEAGDVGDVTLIAGLAEQCVLEGGVAVVVSLNLLLDKGFLPVRNLGEVGVTAGLLSALARRGVLALHDQICCAAADLLALRIQCDVDEVVGVLCVGGVHRRGDLAVVDQFRPVRGALSGLRLIKVDVAAVKRAGAGLAGFGARHLFEEGGAQIHRQHRRRCRTGDRDGVQGGPVAAGEEQVEPAVGIGGPDGEAVRAGVSRSRGVEVAAVGSQRHGAEFRCRRETDLDRVAFRIVRDHQTLGLQGRGELLRGTHHRRLVEQAPSDKEQRPCQQVVDRPGRQPRQQPRRRVEDSNHSGVQLLKDRRRADGGRLWGARCGITDRDESGGRYWRSH